MTCYHFPLTYQSWFSLPQQVMLLLFTRTHWCCHVSCQSHESVQEHAAFSGTEQHLFAQKIQCLLANMWLTYWGSLTEIYNSFSKTIETEKKDRDDQKHSKNSKVRKSLCYKWLQKKSIWSDMWEPEGINLVHPHGAGSQNSELSDAKSYVNLQGSLIVSFHFLAGLFMQRHHKNSA